MIPLQVTTSNSITAACFWPSPGSRPLWSLVCVSERVCICVFYLHLSNAALSLRRFSFCRCDLWSINTTRGFCHRQQSRDCAAVVFDVHMIKGNMSSAEQLTVVNMTTANWSFCLLISSSHTPSVFVGDRNNYCPLISFSQSFVLQLVWECLILCV